MASPPSKTDPIVIVGAGIFGLSTSLHLARRGYTNVTVFDRQNYDKSLYSYQKGCDAASADLNKIIRSGYGGQTEYQELTFEAIEEWKSWNAELAGGNIPPGMSSKDRIFHNVGVVSMNEGTILPPFETATIESMAKEGYAGTQLATTDEDQCSIAREKGFNIDPFRTRDRGKAVTGVLDISGGHVVADKACRFALHKAKALGVRFILDQNQGAFKDFIHDHQGNIAGIRTQDGKSHPAKLTIIACGAWTPTLVPQLDGLCEATAGSVVVFKIPKDSPLYARFSPKNFPVWMYKMRDGALGGLYGFPVDENGCLKFGYRGTKYTNPQVQQDGQERSIPVTRWTEGAKLTEIPQQAFKVITSFVEEYLPELIEENIKVAFTRVCWYTDSFDNHLVIDRVPDQKGLVVATGGSGHAFKYLPNIGNWVVDIIEGKGTDRAAVKAWKWRELGEAKPFNVLMEGSRGSRALQNVRLTGSDDVDKSSRQSKL